MEDLDIIRKQLRLVYPECVIYFNSKNEEIISLDLKPFGNLSMDDKLNIYVTYTNSFGVSYKYLKDFFKERLRFENAAAYFYQDSFIIFKRTWKDSTRTVFENSILRANNFITTANAIEEFLKYNNQKEEI